MKTAIIFVVTTVSFFSVAAADEVWNGSDGTQISYQSDVGSMAVLVSDSGERLYVEGLAENYANRDGVFRGIWIAPSGNERDGMRACGSSRTSADGESSFYWGPLAIYFFRSEFPSGFEIARGYCNDLEEGRSYEMPATTHYDFFVPSVRFEIEGEEQIDFGYNDHRPGMNARYECLERLSRFHEADDFDHLENERLPSGSSDWRITGSAFFRSVNEFRRFECLRIDHRVHETNIAGSDTDRVFVTSNSPMPTAESSLLNAPGRSYGGVVRAGPGMDTRRLDSLPEGASITIIRRTDASMNGYDWFEIQQSNGNLGYQWGGIMCSENTLISGVFQVCR